MASLESIPDEVRDFIDRHINSIEQLEVLLLLWRHRGSPLAPHAIVREIGSTPESIANRLQSLASSGLVEQDSEGFRYRSVTDQDRVVELLAQSYLERRASMITYIINRPNNILRVFSDAFRLRNPRSP